MMDSVMDGRVLMVAKRRRLQWLLAPVVVITVGLGWKYPWLGFVVPVAMATGMVGGFIRGRYVCGNLCPRGGFLDRMLAPLGGRREIPAPVRNMSFRWVVFAALMGFMVWRLSQNPTSLEHWGLVFWSMCALTTGVAVIAGVLVQPRTWCAFCPVGTFAHAVGGHKHRLVIDKRCRQCGACEKACPMDLGIASHKDAGQLLERDCLKCAECTVSCPCGALSWPGES